jgi:tRNA threonylcarbamoyl adenosine modification protein (Sua5/YciO/YrdC/YwlC family)
MSATFHVDPVAPDPGPIRAAAEALAAGDLVVLPTETVYGIAARAGDDRAAAAVFRAKRRPTGLSLPVMAPTADQAMELARPNPAAAALAAAFWPGPLTLVLPRNERSERWLLGDATGTIALRVPDHPVAVAILRAAGPLAVTSANRSGSPPLDDEASLVDAFGDSVAVYLIASAAERAGAASTVVDLTHGAPRIVRSGPIPEGRIRAVVARDP